MAYLHVEVTVAQSAKKRGQPCGDVVRFERTPLWTTVVCCDGLGSGIKANVAAHLAASRLAELERAGVSLREAFSRVVATVHRARGKDLPFSTVSVARVLNNGEATVLTYEMPAPVFVGRGYAYALRQRTYPLGQAVVGETSCQLEAGEGLVLVSDGVTQAGIGTRFAEGWGMEKVAEWLQAYLSAGGATGKLAEQLHAQARLHWGVRQGDDLSVAYVGCRAGRSLTIFTGPPRLPEHDYAVVKRFLASEGWKVVCGATTAKLVARHLGQDLELKADDTSMVAPPRYLIDGIDLVTEGAVTLNQVYNILEEDPDCYEEDSGVTDLCDLLQFADRIHFLVGRAQNPAHQSISFRQRGILSRHAVIPLLRDKLIKAQKLVMVEQV